MAKHDETIAEIRKLAESDSCKAIVDFCKEGTK